jgi:hypothetical protein
MSVSQTGTLLAPTTVAVAPTETTLATFDRQDLKRTSRITVQIVAPSDQLLTVLIYRRLEGVTTYAPTDDSLFGAIPAGTSKVRDVDVGGTDELEVRAYVDGSGGDVVIGATRTSERP